MHYIEQKLVFPKFRFIKNKRVYSFSREDEERLFLAAELRRLFFSFDEIRMLMADTTQIEMIAPGYLERIEDEVDDTYLKYGIIDIINEADFSEILEMKTFIGLFAHLNEGLLIPEEDYDPHYEPETRQADRRVGRIIVVAIAVVNVVLSVIAVWGESSLWYGGLIQVGLSVLLVFGKTWGRTIFWLVTLLGVFFDSFSVYSYFSNGVFDTSWSIWVGEGYPISLFYIFLDMSICIAMLVLLSRNRKVNAYYGIFE